MLLVEEKFFLGLLGRLADPPSSVLSKGLEPPEARARCRVGKIATLDDKKGVG